MLRKKITTCLLLLAITPTLLFSQTTPTTPPAAPASISAINITGLQGDYVLQIRGENVTLVPLTLYNVVKPGTPIPPPQPPTSPSSLRLKAKTLAIATGDPTGIMGLSSVYSIVADKVNSGEIAPGRALAATVQLTDAVLNSLGTTSKWGAWRSAISDDIISLQQGGKLSTKEQYVTVLRDVAGGLEDASKTTGILDNINWENLFKLIMLILELLKTFK